MKRKTLLIILILLVMLMSTASCSNALNKNYIGKYEPGKETQEIVTMLGSNNIFMFEYDASDYNYVSVFLEIYDDTGEKIDGMNISKFGGGDDGSVHNGKILLSLDDLNQLRFAVSTDGGASMVSSQFMDIGAPTEEKGSLTATLTDKAEISDGSAVPLLFVGYMSDENSTAGYYDGLEGIDKEQASAYEFCYRVMVQVEKEMP